MMLLPIILMITLSSLRMIGSNIVAAISLNAFDFSIQAFFGGGGGGGMVTLFFTALLFWYGPGSKDSRS